MHLREQLLTWLARYPEMRAIEFLETPVDRTKGDFALPCFILAKELKTNPMQLATTYVAQMQAVLPAWLERVEATGPYINFFFESAFLATHVIGEVLEAGQRFGYGVTTWQTYVLEGRQPNTHKAFHIWHLRNALISEAIATLLEVAGHNVVRCSYMGDIGAHVAKRIWYYINFSNAPIPADQVSERAGELYAKATEKVSEDKERWGAEIHAIHKRLEEGDPTLVPLRKETAAKCLADMHAINTELGSVIQRAYLESEVEQPGIELVKQLAQQNKGGVHESEWALIVNLEERDLWVFVLLKSNGASLYSTKDLALAYLKQREYTFDASLYVVATEQIHHFNQLFKTLALIGYEWADRLQHIAYGMVELPTGKMSSRDGNVITYYAFRDKLLEIATQLVASRNLPDAEKERLARAVAFGAMKFAFLLPDTFKKIIVDPEQAVSFEWETGPYIQYTYARCCSLLTKAWWNGDLSAVHALTTVQEKLLLLHIADFPLIVQKAARDYKPNMIARFLLDLAHLFNTYYQAQQIRVEDNAELTSARCALVATTKHVLANGLHMLGIEAVERM
jgi:arginyl-tRNA synthetase